MSDPVNNPDHYNSGDIECIDAIRASMSPEEFQGYLKGNTLKYLWRYRYKGSPQEDLAKAQWYLGRLQDRLWDQEEGTSRPVDVPTPECEHESTMYRFTLHNGIVGNCADCGEKIPEI